MIVIKRDNPQIFGGKAFLMSKEESVATNAIAEAISVNRSPLVQLLRMHDVQVNESIPKEELIIILSDTFLKNKDFADAFYKRFATKYSNATDGYTAATVGIMNAFASIFGAFSKPNTTGQQVDFNKQVLLLAAQKEEEKKRNQKIAVISVIVLVVGVAAFLFFYARKQKAI